MLRTFVLFLCLAGGLAAQETVYPTGRPVTVRYSLSSSTPAVADTLVITRTVVNKTAYALHNLYLSDNLPTAFRVVSAAARINGTANPIGMVGPLAGEVIGGYNSYRWILDSPVSGEPWNRSLNPNDSLSVQIRVVCGQVGSYSLPVHTTVCYGNGSGVFATAAPVAVQFRPTNDTVPPAAIIDLGDVTDYSRGPVARTSAPGWATVERTLAG